MCEEREEVEYTEHLWDAVQSAFVPLLDIELVADKIDALETFVTILDAEGVIGGEMLDGLTTAGKTPGIQKHLESVYGKVRDLAAAYERQAKKLKKARGGKSVSVLRKALDTALRTAASRDLLKSAFRHPDIIAEIEPEPSAAQSKAEASNGRTAYAGINAEWRTGSSTEGVAVNGIWNLVNCLNDQVPALTTCCYGCMGGLETVGRATSRGEALGN